MRTFKIASILIVLGSLLNTAYASVEKRVWLIGDSITRGKETPGGVEYPSYRCRLFDLMTNGGG